MELIRIFFISTTRPTRPSRSWTPRRRSRSWWPWRPSTASPRPARTPPAAAGNSRPCTALFCTNPALNIKLSHEYNFRDLFCQTHLVHCSCALTQMFWDDNFAELALEICFGIWRWGGTSDRKCNSRGNQAIPLSHFVLMNCTTSHKNVSRIFIFFKWDHKTRLTISLRSRTTSIWMKKFL